MPCNIYSMYGSSYHTVGFLIHGWHAQEFLLLGGAELCVNPTWCAHYALIMMLTMLTRVLSSLSSSMLIVLAIKLIIMILRTMCLIIPCI